MFETGVDEMSWDDTVRVWLLNTFNQLYVFLDMYL